MQPSKDFTNEVDALSSIAEYVTNTSSNRLESHHLHRHEADEEDAAELRGAQDAQCPSTLGLDAGILEVSGPQYACTNDCVTYGGVCRSNEKVWQCGQKCSNCIVSGFLV